jgi:hypothetical protein
MRSTSKNCTSLASSRSLVLCLGRNMPVAASTAPSSAGCALLLLLLSGALLSVICEAPPLRSKAFSPSAMQGMFLRASRSAASSPFMVKPACEGCKGCKGLVE